MRNICAILLSFLLLLVAACTWRDGYEYIRAVQYHDCAQIFADMERQACMDKTKNDYDAYQRARGVQQPNNVPEDFATYRRKHAASTNAE